MNKRTLVQYLSGIILFGLIHHFAVKLGLLMAYVQPNISPVWPPSGIALAVLLLFGLRMWPGIFLSVFVGSLLERDLPGIAIGLAIANSLEAVVGCLLLNWLGFENALNRTRDVIRFVVVCGLATVASASLGSAAVFILSRSSVPFFTLWLTWWVGNFLGCLVVTPFLITWFTLNLRSISHRQLVEGLSLLFLLTVVTWSIFNFQPGATAINQALIFIVFPFIVWAALRIEMRGATLAAVLVSGIALSSTVSGHGPFSDGSLNDSLILLQTFMSVVSLTSLLLTSASTERRNAEELLHQRIRGLASLNSASKVFLDNLGKRNTYETICQLAKEHFQLCAVWIEEMTGNAEAAAALACSSLEHASQRSRSLLVTNPCLQEAIAQTKRDGHPQVVDRFELQPLGWGEAAGSFAALPLQYSGETFGVLCVVGPQPEMFSGDHLLLMQSYTNLAAVAVQNSWLFDQVRSGNEQLHALSRRLMEIQEAERLNLSRELHDESGQILAMLMVRLGLLERDATHPELVRDHVESLKEIVKNVLDNLHEIAVKLRPASLDRLGLVIGLQQYVQEFSRQHAIDVQLDMIGDEIGRLPEEMETALFRIVQEALINVILHAHASRVDILLRRRKDSLAIMIEDNGVGFDPGYLYQENRLGLFGMRERIEILGGSFQVESAPGNGTTIVVEVPYEDTRVNC